MPTHVENTHTHKYKDKKLNKPIVINIKFLKSCEKMTAIHTTILICIFKTVFPF